jgi:putative ABC transport system substrate-binding protein
MSHPLLGFAVIDYDAARGGLETNMRRREFLSLIGGVVMASPKAAVAQQAAMKRVGVLMGAREDDRSYQVRIKAFQQSLASLGWNVEGNIHIDVRWGIAESDIRKGAKELVGLSPDAILANAVPSVLALQKASRTIPIVFVAVTDPVLLGLVKSLARPGGNITGFTSAEVAMSGKWLELLKEIAPDLKRVGIFAPPSNLGAQAQIGAIQAVAPSLQVDLSRIVVGDPGEMERSVSGLASSANSGLIMSRTVETISALDLIISLAAKYKLPAVYPYRDCITRGGLASYGPDIVTDYRKAAAYVDRILKGEKPVDLPVQVPTKYELVINQKTAKALGLTLPPTLLASADDVIE